MLSDGRGGLETGGWAALPDGGLADDTVAAPLLIGCEEGVVVVVVAELVLVGGVVVMAVVTVVVVCFRRMLVSIWALRRGSVN